MKDGATSSREATIENKGNIFLLNVKQIELCSWRSMKQMRRKIVMGMLKRSMKNDKKMLIMGMYSW